MKKILFLLVFLCAGQVSKAQSASIKGMIKEISTKGIEYASVSLHKTGDTSLVTGTITDAKGTYNLMEVKRGQYLIKVTLLGYEKYCSAPIQVQGQETVSLPDIVLKQTEYTLKGVQVTAQRPWIERKFDKLIVNVENNSLTSSGTALDVLSKSPGVWVQDNGAVMLNGKGGVLVMIDGKPAHMTAEQLSIVLSSMPAGNVSRLEIIANPSSKYDAQGASGIINIELKKNKKIGMNGTVQSSFTQGRYPKLMTGFGLNYKNEKVNYLVNYDYTNKQDFLDLQMQRTANNFKFDQKAFRHIYTEGHNVRLGLDWQITPKAIFGALVTGFSNDMGRPMLNNTISETLNPSNRSFLTTDNDENKQLNNVSVNLNYKVKLDTLGSDMTMDADFSQYSSRVFSAYKTKFSDENGASLKGDEALNSANPSVAKIASFKLDYTKPFSKDLKTEWGLKTTLVKTDNEILFDIFTKDGLVRDNKRSGHYNYLESVHAGYTNWEYTFRKWHLQGGLRAEYTNTEGKTESGISLFDRHFLSLFPSAVVQKEVNQNYSWSVSYSRRIDRPTYDQLNPFVLYVDPNSSIRGNPYLRPEFTNAFEFTHTIAGAYTAALFFNYSTNVNAQVPIQNAQTGEQSIVYANLDKMNQYGLNISAPFKPASWWTLVTNLTFFRSDVSSNFETNALTNGMWTAQLYGMNNFKMKKGWSADLSGFYMSGFVQGVYKVKPLGSLSMGVQKVFLRNQAKLKIAFNDILRTSNELLDVNIAGQTGYVNQYRDRRTATLTFSYRFSKGTIFKARQRKSTIEGEQKRANAQ